MALLFPLQQLSLLVIIIHNEWIWCPRLMKPDLLNPTAVSLNVYFIWACTHMKRHLHPTAVFCSSYHRPHYPSGHTVFQQHRTPSSCAKTKSWLDGKPHWLRRNQSTKRRMTGKMENMTFILVSMNISCHVCHITLDLSKLPILRMWVKLMNWLKICGILESDGGQEEIWIKNVIFHIRLDLCIGRFVVSLQQETGFKLPGDLSSMLPSQWQELCLHPPTFMFISILKLIKQLLTFGCGGKVQHKETSWINEDVYQACDFSK